MKATLKLLTYSEATELLILSLEPVDCCGNMAVLSASWVM